MTRLFAGRGELERGRWARSLKAAKACLVTEAEADRLFGDSARAALTKAGLPPITHHLPTGEAAKAWPAVEELLRALARQGCGRDSVIVALGGGAVTDAAGFAAAIYLRGVPWVSVPTTLLGQLDSGLGGKTAINIPEGKNLVGAFHQPAAVVCDTACLKTLPERERVSGLAEAIKYGLVFERPLWTKIRAGWGKLLLGDEALTADVVRRGAGIKLKIVAADERETRGKRELLNFGHTLGHALETVSGHALRHGEAVVWGMRAAVALSRRAAGLDAAEARSVDDFLRTIPIPMSGADSDLLLEAARRDKKARAGALRFVLLRGLARPVVKAVAEPQVRAAIEEVSR